MTTLTSPAGAGLTRRSHRAGRARNARRQHRLALIGLLVVFAGLAPRLILTGVPLHAAYAQYLLHHCVTQRHPACGRLLTRMNAGSRVLGSVGIHGMTVLRCL